MKRILFAIIAVLMGITANAQEPIHNDTISEVIVTAKLVKRTADGDQYLITDKMRSMAVNSYELFAHIPGVQLNRASNQILINNKSNILFLVNGRPQSNEYIMSLPPETIKQVKVIHNPKGRYSSEGYDAVIEITSRKADGWDVNLSNMLLANPSKNNGSNHILMEQPAFNIAYTLNKFSIYGSGGYGISKWNTPVVNDLNVNPSETEITTVSGIEKYGYNGRVASAGLNYNISSKHVLSFDYDFMHENDAIANDMKGFTRNYFQNDRTCRVSNTYTLYYKGQFGDKLDVYSDFSINNYRNDYTNLYSDFTEDITNINTEKRKAIDFTADLKWTFSDKLELKFGALAHDRKFQTEGNNFDYHRTQSRAWGYLVFNPTQQWSIEAGLALDNNVINYSDKKRTESKVLPSLQVSYTPAEDVTLKASYTSDAIYPNLKQLSTIRSAVYPNVYHLGYPDLKNATKHKMSIEINVFDMLNFSPSFTINNRAISPLVLNSGIGYEMTYRNADTKELLLPMNIDFPLSERIFCSLGAGYYKSFGKYQDIRSNYGGFYYNADVIYQGKFANLNASYYHSIQKESLIQGYNETGLDSWMLAVNKQWNKSLSTSICWFLPFDFGIKSDMTKSIQSDKFYLQETKSLKPYRNTFNIQIVYRFQSGKSKVSRKQNEMEVESRISGGMAEF